MEKIKFKKEKSEIDLKFIRKSKITDSYWGKYEILENPKT